MAQPNTINPYGLIGQELQNGLNAIIAALPVSPTVDDLVTEVYNYVQPIYYQNASQAISIELKSIAYNAINSYRNNLVLTGDAFFGPSIMPFIQLMIGPGMTANLAPDSFQDRIADIEDNIGTSELNVNDQQPLFLGTTIGDNAFQYWTTEVGNPNSPWVLFFSANAGQNYLNTLLWSTAAMNGALAGYGSVSNSLVDPTINIVTNKMVSALIGALTVSAGKLIFNWIPRITKPVEINRRKISSLQRDIVQPNQNEYARGSITGFTCGGTWSVSCAETCGTRLCPYVPGSDGCCDSGFGCSLC